MLATATDTLSVLHLIETAGRGGAESIVVNLATARRESAAVASLRAGWLIDELEDAGIEVTVIPYTMRSDALLVLRIARLIERVGPDVVHCHCFTMNTVGALAAALVGVPSIATVHGLIYDLDTRKRLLAYRLAGKLHHRIVTVSHYLRDELHKRAGIPLDKIEVVYNGVAAHDSARNAAHIRSEAGVSDGEVLVGSVGMLRPEKGHSDLIEAVALARQSVPEIGRAHV